jgi:hypothetical protein
MAEPVDCKHTAGPESHRVNGPGDNSAYEMFWFLVQNASAEPGTFRTEGENHIIVHQGRLDCDWWITTQGAACAPHSERNLSSHTECHPTAHAPSLRTIPTSLAGTPQHPDGGHATNTIAPRPTNGGWSFVSTVPIHPVVLPNHPRAPPGEYALEGHGYLGTSPPDPTDTVPPMVSTGEFHAWRRLPNTLGTVVEVTCHYSFADTHTWATGMRNMLGRRHWPGGDTVHTGDAIAYQTCIALGPDDWRGLDHQWRMFYETLILMFSIPGLYAHIVAVGGVPGGISAHGTLSLPYRQHHHTSGRRVARTTRDTDHWHSAFSARGVRSLAA